MNAAAILIDERARVAEWARSGGDFGNGRVFFRRWVELRPAGSDAGECTPERFAARVVPDELAAVLKMSSRCHGADEDITVLDGGEA